MQALDRATYDSRSAGSDGPVSRNEDVVDHSVRLSCDVSDTVHLCIQEHRLRQIGNRSSCRPLLLALRIL